jgi:hypothetical protein
MVQQALELLKSSETQPQVMSAVTTGDVNSTATDVRYRKQLIVRIKKAHLETSLTIILVTVTVRRNSATVH